MLQISRTNERPVNNNLCFKYVQKQLKMKTIAIILGLVSFDGIEELLKLTGLENAKRKKRNIFLLV